MALGNNLYYVDFEWPLADFTYRALKYVVKTVLSGKVIKSILFISSQNLQRPENDKNEIHTIIAIPFYFQST